MFYFIKNSSVMISNTRSGLKFEIGEKLRTIMTELMIVGKVESHENFSIDLFNDSIGHKIRLNVFPGENVNLLTNFR